MLRITKFRSNRKTLSLACFYSKWENEMLISISSFEVLSALGIKAKKRFEKWMFKVCQFSMFAAHGRLHSLGPVRNPHLAAVKPGRLAGLWASVKSPPSLLSLCWAPCEKNGVWGKGGGGLLTVGLPLLPPWTLVSSSGERTKDEAGNGAGSPVAPMNRSPLWGVWSMSA